MVDDDWIDTSEIRRGTELSSALDKIGDPDKTGFDSQIENLIFSRRSTLTPRTPTGNMIEGSSRKGSGDNCIEVVCEENRGLNKNNVVAALLKNTAVTLTNIEANVVAKEDRVTDMEIENSLSAQANPCGKDSHLMINVGETQVEVEPKLIPVSSGKLDSAEAEYDLVFQKGITDGINTVADCLKWLANYLQSNKNVNKECRTIYTQGLDEIIALKSLWGKRELLAAAYRQKPTGNKKHEEITSAPTSCGGGAKRTITPPLQDTINPGGERKTRKVNKRREQVVQVTQPHADTATPVSGAVILTTPNAGENVAMGAVEAIPVSTEENNIKISQRGWETIRTKRKKDPSRGVAVSNEGQRLEQMKSKQLRPKNEAIIVTATEKRTYADVFRQIAGSLKSELRDVKTVRKSRAGDLLIEFTNKANNTPQIKEAIKTVMGETHSVRVLLPKTDIEIRDLDPIVGKDEIVDKIARHLAIEDKDEVRMKVLRTTYYGTQLAVIELPTKRVQRLKNGDRINIGYTACRIKIMPKLTRCFRCHGFGHISQDCPQNPIDGLICRRCAQDLLIKTVEDLKIDIVFISEPYVIKENWISDTTRKAAIWVTGLNGRKALADKTNVGRGFAAVSVDGTYHCSCYYSPRLKDTELEVELMELENAKRTWGPAMVVAGDFNAKSPTWGSKFLDKKGLVLTGSFDRMGLIPTRPRGKFTFQRGGRTSLIDVMACDQRTLTRISKNIPLSDSEAGEVIDALQNACSASMTPRRQCPVNKTCKKWWSPELTNLRREANSKRRIYQRALKKGRLNAPEAGIEYKIARKKLKGALIKHKIRAWSELCNTVDSDIWGAAYKTVMKTVKPKCDPPNLTVEKTYQIITALFPREENQSAMDTYPQYGQRPFHVDFTPLDPVELRRAVARVSLDKAPGIDMIPGCAVKLVLEKETKLVVNLLNGILIRGKIPRVWKNSKLILIAKAGKDPSSPSAYRPLCLTSNWVKILESVINTRIIQEIGPEGLSDHQYGFRAGRSTIQALKLVEEFQAVARIKQEYSLLITFDIRNAFNSLRWKNIKNAARGMGLSNYLLALIDDYLCDRTISYQAEGTWHQVKMEMGVPQGSVLGPTLWNITYDGLLKIPIRNGCRLVAFADDIALLARDGNKALLKEKISSTINDILKWLTLNQLTLAPEKTEAIALNNKRLGRMSIRILNTRLKISTELKYLGLHYDRSHKFRVHIEYICKKAARVMSALARITPNVGGPGYKTGLTYYYVMESILLYAAPIWASALELEVNRIRLQNAQCLGLGRVVKTYRTVAREVLPVLAGVLPILLKVKERQEIFQIESRIKRARLAGHDLRIPDLNGEKARVRSQIMDEWQRSWDANRRGNISHKWIPDIAKWIKATHGQLTYHMSQAFTGHGCFNQFRKRIGKATSDLCWYGCNEIDDAEHTFTQCQKWAENKQQLCERLNIDVSELTIEYLGDVMMRDLPSWNVIKTYITNILKEKEDYERELDREARLAAQAPLPS
ncbi:uncharacterized protein LOC143350585 [Colletes latitarsis]|uniref:uncharacterized protein LOC143350585 n=1 Tax=Colletes latitarsis TaxID=2605962 RepID=UPI004035D571